MEQLREPGVARRSFLSYFLGASLLAFLGAALYPMARFFWPPRETSSGGSASVSIPVTELPIGRSKMIRFAGGPVVVIRTDKGVYALSAICTHLGCIVRWEENNNRLFCPCHAAIFDVNGTVLGGPAPRPLPAFSAKIAGDQIVVGEA